MGGGTEPATRPALFLIPRGSGAGRDSEQVVRSHSVFLGKFLGLPRSWGLTSKAGFWGSLGGGAPEGVLGVCLTDQTGALTMPGDHREGGLGAPHVSTHKPGREGPSNGGGGGGEPSSGPGLLCWSWCGPEEPGVEVWESRGCTNRPPGPGVSPQGRSGRRGEEELAWPLESFRRARRWVSGPGLAQLAGVGRPAARRGPGVRGWL